MRCRPRDIETARGFDLTMDKTATKSGHLALVTRLPLRLFYTWLPASSVCTLTSRRLGYTLRLDSVVDARRGLSPASRR